MPITEYLKSEKTVKIHIEGNSTRLPELLVNETEINTRTKIQRNSPLQLQSSLVTEGTIMALQ